MGLFHLELIHYYVTHNHIQSCSNTPEKTANSVNKLTIATDTDTYNGSVFTWWYQDAFSVIWSKVVSWDTLLYPHHFCGPLYPYSHKPASKIRIANFRQKYR